MSALQYVLESPLRWVAAGARHVLATIERIHSERQDRLERRYGLNG
ncbi:hypothetical protein G6N76_02570 [Rhizobium daejeonense]|uniref:Uncharacterized protein n=1 Tax=Rhizobium daejeonense TaxID=240521 RepID=A0A6M1RUP2_9HYPH|nr:hypothetical protein [Rhizobium daejeonense]NGO62543.1 hypothetical protein [Rhizobium daejeonense]